MSLARLVVHLESNYSGLVGGVNQSVAAVNALQSRVGALPPTTQAAETSITSLGQSARQLTRDLKNVTDAGSLHALGDGAATAHTELRQLSGDLTGT